MKRPAFTLTELVAVVLILGILAIVALPRLGLMSTPDVKSTVSSANDGGLQQTLTVIRDAIDLYSIQNGGRLPGADGQESTFKSDLAPYLRRSFPACPVGALNNQIDIRNQPAIHGVPSPTRGWKYSCATGRFIANYNQPTTGDPTVDYDDL